jgi:hypothetical protein
MDWCFFSLYLLFLLALGIYREQDPQTKKRKKHWVFTKSKIHKQRKERNALTSGS